MLKALFKLQKVLILTVLSAFLLAGSACDRRVHYSSDRVYNAQREQNKRLKQKGYSNDQQRKNRKQLEKQRRKRQNFKKSKSNFSPGRSRK